MAAEPIVGEQLRKSRVWTLALDESGDFESGRDLVLGGVLLPGEPEESQRKLSAFRAWGVQNFGTTHAGELTDIQRQSLRVAAAEALAKCGGTWLFVVCDARDRREQQASIFAYVRLLAAAVDLAGRLAACSGVKALHLRPAQRTIALTNEARERGLVGPSFKGDLARPMSEAEARACLEALAREPRGALPAVPEAATVRVESANSGRPELHSGMLLADIGCNAVLGTLGRRERGPLTALLGPFQPGILVPLLATDKLRNIDRAFRESPAALVRAAKLVAELEADTLGLARNDGDQPALRQGASACARLLWEEAVRGLAPSGAAGRTHALAALAELELEQFSGSYEGLALALESGWSGESELAREHRAQVPTRELAARLWRLCCACANHRGDETTAAKALAEFERLLADASSLHLAAEELDIRNEAVVTLQNAFPCAAERAPQLHAELEQRTQALVIASERAATQCDAAATRGGASEQELQLWRAGTGAEPSWLVPNRQLGMTLGTSARSLAFGGQLDAAVQLAFRARAHFDSALDLNINAAHIARIELERARVDRAGAAARTELLAAALGLCGALAFGNDAKVPDFTQRLSARFAFDIALRALLWAPASPLKKGRFVEWLAQEEFVVQASRGALRSHPSELIARHGAELLRQSNMTKPAARLFDLSLELCGDAAAGTTLSRFSLFTQRLRDEPKAGPEGPAGSLFNPVFEYR